MLSPIFIGFAAEPAKAPVSEDASPLQVVDIPTQGGRATTPAVIRRPPGARNAPAVIFLHGGLETQPVDRLKATSRGPNTMSRFLAAGWITVVPTFRPRNVDPQTRDALLDCLDVLAYVKKMPEADPRRVVIYGTSGGGSLAVEIAGEVPLPAAVAEEPASILFTGMFTKEYRQGDRKMSPSDGQDLMDNPNKYYTAAIRKITQDKIRRVQCPMFFAEGGVHVINRINNEIVFPEFAAAGKDFEVKLYPAQRHGFSMKSDTFFEDCQAFLARHVSPRP
ncbi:MAG TPA: prolyl oligopeptidase family serine peptidase [Bryobacteraceae bacterium]|jgi:acetyl esterase/lipase|nr:prolyl oligopeptidase family serine peptidase [Bryobacteraceae bacterium]